MPSNPTPPDRYAPEAGSLLVQRALGYIDVADWRFARTMANIPHWYCMRERAYLAGRGAAHEALFLLIKWHGYPRQFYSKSFVTVDLAGWKIWMITDGSFLNAAPIGEPFGPVPTCIVHRGEPMWLDEAKPYRYWHCPPCDRTAR